MIAFLHEHASILLLCVCALSVIGFVLCVQTERVRTWLLYAVTEAEAQFGSNTGQLKLLDVYNKFISQFPNVSLFISFNLFSKMVDVALYAMKAMLENNSTIEDFVKGKTT